MADDQNVAAYINGVKDITVKPVSKETCGANDVMVKMDSVGICGSDLHFYLDGGIAGLFDIEAPTICGHEGSGVVTEVGAEVKNLKIGDRVVLDPNCNCQFCDHCINNKDNLCTESRRYYWPPYRGLNEKYHVHPAAYTFKLADSVSLEEAAVIEPVTCALHAIQRGGTACGHKVLICGAGPIGLVHMKCAVAYGASTVIVTDIDEERLKAAKEMGATHTVLIDPKTQTPESVASHIQDLLGGSLVDITFDASGAEYSYLLGIHACKSGGKVVMTGLGHGDAKLPTNVISNKEIDMLGIIRYRSACFREAIELVTSGKVDVKPLITHRFPLARSKEAYDLLVDRNSRVLKVMIKCNE